MAKTDKAPRQEGKRPRIRGALGRKMMEVGILRRWYVRRTIKFIDKSKAKGRRLPDSLVETARQLSRVPKPQREKVLEEAILAGGEDSGMGREFRRAAARKRLSTRSDTRYRPGRAPGGPKQHRPRPR